MIDFVLGERYYQFELNLTDGRLIPHVVTWIYRGYIRKEFSSSSCDLPFHFYEFVRDNVASPSDNDIILIPSHSQAAASIYSWEDFCKYVQAPIDELESDGE